MQSLTVEQKLVLAESLLDHSVDKAIIKGAINTLAENLELLGGQELASVVRGLSKFVHTQLSKYQEMTSRTKTPIYTTSSGKSFTLAQLLAMADGNEPIASATEQPKPTESVQVPSDKPYVVPATAAKETHWVGGKGTWLFVGRDGVKECQIWRAKGTLPTEFVVTLANLQAASSELEKATQLADGSYTCKPHTLLRVNYRKS